MFEVGKIYDTRGGGKVRIICNDRPHNRYPIVGLAGAQLDTVRAFTSDGQHFSRSESDFDIVLPRRKLWVLYNRHNRVVTWRHKEASMKDYQTQPGEYWLEMEEVR